MQAELEKLGMRTPGRNAVIVRSIDDHWVAGFRGATTFPQGSLRRIWLGAALLEAVDHGELSLDQRVPLLFSGSPGQERREDVRSLLRKAVGEDDRSSQDEILAGLMGPSGMAAWLDSHGFEEVAFGPANRDMVHLRQGKQGQGLPVDGATPDGIAFAAGELFAGKLLKDESAELLLQLFGQNGSAPDASNSQLLRLTGISPLTGPAISAGGIVVFRTRTGQRHVIVVFAAGVDNPVRIRDEMLTDVIAALQQH